MRKLTQDEWDDTAESAGFHWLAPVKTTNTATEAQCNTCAFVWEATPANTRHRGSGCPKCAGLLKLTQEDWDERAEAVGLEWLEPVAARNARTRARCTSCEHEWKASPAAVSTGSGCPQCGKLKAAQSRRLSQQEWDDSAQAAGLRWLEDVGGGKAPTLAECLECGHGWKATPNNVRNRGDGCPECGRGRVSQEEWDSRAATVNVEWLGAVRGVQDITEARCLECGYTWKARPNKIQQGFGCWKCEGRREPRFKIDQEEWDRRAAAVNVEWLDEVERNDVRTRARCKTCKYEWLAWPISVQSGSGCPICARERMGTGAGGRPRVSSEEWAKRASEKGLMWLGEVSDGDQFAPIRCLTCDHEWKRRPAHLQRSKGCPQCDRARRAALARRPQKEWDEIAAKVGLRWLEPVANSSTPTLTRCLSCEYEWKSTPSKRAEGSGCPVCSAAGFDPSAPSLVYLLDDGAGSAKVGITNTNRKGSRTRQHELNGWTVVRTWPVATGEIARSIELAVLEWWRTELHLAPTYPPGSDGWTETVSTRGVSVRRTANCIIRLLDSCLGGSVSVEFTASPGELAAGVQTDGGGCRSPAEFGSRDDLQS